jgi:hypothetical protein
LEKLSGGKKMRSWLLGLVGGFFVGGGSAIAPLSQEALAKRLKISGRGLANNRLKGNEHLMEWSKKRDPDGIAWQYGGDKKHHPA